MFDYRTGLGNEVLALVATDLVLARSPVRSADLIVKDDVEKGAAGSNVPLYLIKPSFRSKS